MNARTSYTSGSSVPLTRWSGTNSYDAMRARREATRTTQHKQERPEQLTTSRSPERKPERRAAARELKPAKRPSSRPSFNVLLGGMSKTRPAAFAEEAPTQPKQAPKASEKLGGTAAGFVGLLGSVRRTAASFLLRHPASIVVLALIAIIASMLYSPLREYYVAQRSLSSLEATHSALVEDNNQLREELAVLQTQQGIEDEARLHGYVKRGEVSVKVEDIPEGTVANRADSAAAQEPAVESEHPWYEGFLDALFGYTPEG